MKTIYLDSNFMCHLINDGTMQEIQTDVFDIFCDKAVEFFRYVPINQTWTRPDGRIIHGEFIQALEDVMPIQRQYENDIMQMQDMQTALEILGVSE